MKVIEPSVRVIFHHPIDPETGEQIDIDQFIERAGRICYKSEDRITPTSAEAFVRMIEKRGHHSVIEHATASAHFVCSRGETHELVRHRLASYSQECLAGDTEVRKGRTVKELYERSLLKRGRAYNRRFMLRSCGTDGVIVPNEMVDVWYKGRAPIFEVESSLGYRIKTTENHEFCTPSGEYVRLSDLTEGDEVMVNGRPSLLCIDDDVLQSDYVVHGLSPQEIAEQYGAPYRSVLRRLKALGIFEKHRNDKNYEKYNRGHTVESYQKMRSIILAQYENGRTPWNKGLTETENESVSRQADALRSYHWNNGFAEQNSNWKGGVSQSYYSRLKVGLNCELCGANAIETHHKNSDRRDNCIENIVRVCGNCHDKLHAGWHVGRVAHPDRIVRITPIGVDDVYDIEMSAPINNFVANGFIVHNSTRYCNYGKERFGKTIGVIQPPFVWKDSDSREHQMKVIGEWRFAMLDCESHYLNLLELGQPPEIARYVLPIGLKTEIIMTANIREWMHVFMLRCQQKAHPAIRGLTRQVLSEFAEHIPSIFVGLQERILNGDG